MLVIDELHIPSKDRDLAARRAYRLYYKFKNSLSTAEVENPTNGSMEHRILFDSGEKKLIILKSEEKKNCIGFYYHRCKAESARKLKKRIDRVFCGVSERDVQLYINNSSKSQAIKGRFENKPSLKPVKSSKVWDHVQIDLMSMDDMPLDIDFKQYRWVLSCIDVFSRYLVLRPLYSKDTAIVAEQLLQVFADLGVPSVIQSDRGSEFQGCVNQLSNMLSVKIVHSSVRHPQSQGKVCNIRSIPRCHL